MPLNYVNLQAILQLYRMSDVRAHRVFVQADWGYFWMWVGVMTVAVESVTCGTTMEKTSLCIPAFDAKVLWNLLTIISILICSLNCQFCNLKFISSYIHCFSVRCFGFEQVYEE